ncbi:MAG: Acetyltransferase (GNAT) family protein [Alphaproteobacteria bacterium ADurb.Bin438]|nr:MAG: Acetyltransferase (GNAT) family protein [Alphaproteobacteria bacterium ADurb.Bin438]
MIELIYPNIKYKDSFIRAVKELVSYKDPFFGQLKKYSEFDFEKLENDFYNYKIKPLEDERAGKNLPKEFVSHSVMWAIDNDEFIARFDIRHTLNDNLMNIGGHIAYVVRPSKRGQGYGKKALRLALSYANRELNIKEALITADYKNEASIKTILGVLKEYGGRADTPYIKPDDKGIELRFWINTFKK